MSLITSPRPLCHIRGQTFQGSGKDPFHHARVMTAATDVEGDPGKNNDHQRHRGAASVCQQAWDTGDQQVPCGNNSALPAFLNSPPAATTPSPAVSPPAARFHGDVSYVQCRPQVGDKQAQTDAPTTPQSDVHHILIFTHKFTFIPLSLHFPITGEPHSDVCPLL